jgi:hypothetical protein
MVNKWFFVDSEKEMHEQIQGNVDKSTEWIGADTNG